MAKRWGGPYCVIAALASAPLSLSAQTERPAAGGAQTGTGAALPPEGNRTIQDAVIAPAARERGRGRDKSSPALALGSPGSFFGPDAYPPEALRAGEEGRAVVQVEIDVRGSPTGCSVLASSNSTVLDAATCRIAQTRMQYAAARDGQGKPVASQYTLPVRWVLPRNASSPTFDLTDGRKAVIDVTMAIGLDAQGRVTSCRVVEQLPAGAMPCLNFPAGKAGAVRAIRNGVASAATMTVVNRVYLDQP